MITLTYMGSKEAWGAQQSSTIIILIYETEQYFYAFLIIIHACSANQSCCMWAIWTLF